MQKVARVQVTKAQKMTITTLRAAGVAMGDRKYVQVATSRPFSKKSSRKSESRSDAQKCAAEDLRKAGSRAAVEGYCVNCA